MTDKRVKELVGELHALLQGDTGYKMAEGDVEFFDAGRDGTVIVDICGRRYLVMVKDLGVSAQAAVEPPLLRRKLNS